MGVEGRVVSGDRIVEGVEDDFRLKETQTLLLAQQKEVKEREQENIEN